MLLLSCTQLQLVMVRRLLWPPSVHVTAVATMSQRYGANWCAHASDCPGSLSHATAACDETIFRKFTQCSIVFAEEHGGAEGQKTGCLDALADAASAQQESEEREEREEDQSIEASQELQEEEKVARDSEEGGMAEVGKTHEHWTEEGMPRQDS